MKYIKDIARAGIIAAAYIALTLVFAPISFGVVQCRVSEALCILPLFSPVAVWGLFAGCLVSNFFSATFSIFDVVFGSLTTLAAAFLTYKTRKKPLLAASFPVVLNGIVVGGYLSFLTGMPPIYCMLTVAAGEAVALYLIGIPLYHMTKNKFKKLFQ